MRVVIALIITGTLAACGADGEPIRPQKELGVVISSDGVHVGGRIGASKGPVTVTLGF